MFTVSPLPATSLPMVLPQCLGLCHSIGVK